MGICELPIGSYEIRNSFKEFFIHCIRTKHHCNTSSNSSLLNFIDYKLLYFSGFFRWNQRAFWFPLFHSCRCNQLLFLTLSCAYFGESERQFRKIRMTFRFKWNSLPGWPLSVPEISHGWLSRAWNGALRTLNWYPWDAKQRIQWPFR